MTLPELASVFIALFFGIIAIFLIYQSESEKKQLSQRQSELERKVKKFQILSQIQQKIDHSHSTQDLLSIILQEISLLYEYTTASYILITDQSAVFKTHIFDKTHKSFLLETKAHTLKSFQTLSGADAPKQIQESVSGTIDETQSGSLNSFYAVSLLENGKIIGLLCLASEKKNLYQEQDMQFLHDIIDHSSLILSKLHSISYPLKNYYAPLVENLGQPLIFFNPRCEIILLNKSAKQILGDKKTYKTADDIASEFSQGKIVVLKIKECLSNQKSVEIPQLQTEEKTVKLLLSPVKNESQELVGASLLIVDQTQEKQKEKLKDDFSAMVVHELRAPLASMRSAAELLLSPDGKLKKEDQKKLLALMESQSKRLLDDVSSILDAAKLDNGKFTIEKSYEEIKSILSKSIDEFMPQAESKHIKLALSVDDLLPKTQLDSQRFSQIMANLLSNSLKFTPEEGEITVQAARENSNIKITVTDSGIGIEKERQKDLFTKFFQVSHPRYPALHPLEQNPAAPSALNSSYHSGTGLGLYIVKGIVQAHGGSVLLESTPGKGTTVSFTIPIVEQEPTPTQPSQTVQPQTAQQPRPFVFTKPASRMVN